MGKVKAAAGTFALALALAAPATAAPVDSPILIRSLSPGLGGEAAAEYVMAQMTVDGQQHVTGETLTFYGPTGAVTGTWVIPSDVANGQSQRTILLATPQAASQSEFPISDFSLTTGDALDPSGGAVCLTGGFPADCASWGLLPATVAHALPDPQSFNAEAVAGALRRWNGEDLSPPFGPTRGCETWLGPSDDNGNSNADFFESSAMPLWNNALNPISPPSSAIPCQLNTLFNQTPSNPTNDTTPTFAFGEVPSEYGVEFQCRFGSGSSLPGGLAWSSCPRSGNTYGPLADGAWAFQAKAVGAAGPDPTPLSWAFEVDTVPPQTFIDSAPPEPSNGFSATFSFHSNEAKAKFQCQFESGQIQPCEPGKTIFGLSDGPHVFRVQAIDQATNVDPTPAEVTFNVDTTRGDKTAPDTTILSHPANPSSTGKATFTWRSNEPRSTFQCSLDGAPFSSCDPAGITYPRLKNGPHNFKVKATDRAGNTDSVPASFNWTTKAPLPDTRITSSPPGFQRIQSGAKTLKVSFSFRSNEPKAEFRCRLDQGEFKPCKSPTKLKATAGRRRFEVYVIDAVGNVETTPARRIFRIGGSKRHQGFFRAGGGR